MRRTGASLVLAGVLAGTLPACSDGDETPKYDLRPRAARSQETPLPYRETRVAEMVYSVMGIRTRIGDVVGNHGSILPSKGQYVRIRLSVENRGRDRHLFHGSRQMLVMSDGQVYKTNFDATSVSRAPTGPQTLARDERREFDLWYDVPKTATPRALRVTGDATSSAVGDAVKETPSASTATADIPLTG